MGLSSFLWMSPTYSDSCRYILNATIGARSDVDARAGTRPTSPLRPGILAATIKDKVSRVTPKSWPQRIVRTIAGRHSCCNSNSERQQSNHEHYPLHRPAAGVKMTYQALFKEVKPREPEVGFGEMCLDGPHYADHISLSAVCG